MKWKITCKEATTFISQQEEGRLTFQQRLQLWLHLGICSLCKLFYRQNKIITANSQHLHEHTEASLTTAEKQNIINTIEEIK